MAFNLVSLKPRTRIWFLSDSSNKQKKVTAALPRPQEEEETDKSKQAQIEQTYEKH